MNVGCPLRFIPCLSKSVNCNDMKHVNSFIPMLPNEENRERFANLKDIFSSFQDFMSLSITQFGVKMSMWLRVAWKKVVLIVIDCRWFSSRYTAMT